MKTQQHEEKLSAVQFFYKANTTILGDELRKRVTDLMDGYADQWRKELKQTEIQSREEKDKEYTDAELNEFCSVLSLSSLPVSPVEEESEEINEDSAKASTYPVGVEVKEEPITENDLLIAEKESEDEGREEALDKEMLANKDAYGRVGERFLTKEQAQKFDALIDEESELQSQLTQSEEWSNKLAAMLENLKVDIHHPFYRRITTLLNDFNNRNK